LVFCNRLRVEGLQIKEQSPELAKKSHVMEVSLDRVYDFALDPKASKVAEGVIFRFMPDAQQVQHALSVCLPGCSNVCPQGAWERWEGGRGVGGEGGEPCGILHPLIWACHSLKILAQNGGGGGGFFRCTPDAQPVQHALSVCLPGCTSV